MGSESAQNVIAYQEKIGISAWIFKHDYDLLVSTYTAFLIGYITIKWSKRVPELTFLHTPERTEQNN